MLKVAYSDVYAYDLPKGHRFPMDKYPLLAEQLLYEGTLEQENFFEPSLLKVEDLLLTHSAEYWNKMSTLSFSAKEIRDIGFPMSKHFVDRGRYIAQGTLDAYYYAQEYGVSFNIAGGTHHAYYAKGGGFCLLNDFAIAANVVLRNDPSARIMIVDLDVHQGDGTASLFRAVEQVFTFSMHGANNYPMQKQVSDFDLALADGIEDEEYLDLLYEHLPKCISKFAPTHVFYLSGVDILSSDRLGRLNVTLDGCRLRDEFVFEYCKNRSLPISVSMGGGYSLSLNDIVFAHANTFRVATSLYCFL